MTTTELEKIINDRLGAAGLLPLLDRTRSQLLGFPEGVFVELVLTDASKLRQVENTLNQIRTELAQEGTQIDSIVRALWRVESVEYQGPARAPTGEPKLALAFRAVLESGQQACEVVVELHVLALNELRKKMGKATKVGSFSWSEIDDVDRGTLESVAAQFLTLQLLAGGTSYWDPIRFGHQELNEPAMMYLLARTAAFRALETLINDTLDPDPRNLLLQEFLTSLSNARIKIRDFEYAISCLPAVFGGPYGPGQELMTSPSGAYAKLDGKEKELIKAHFLQRVTQLEQSLPALKDKFPMVFAR